VLREINIWKDIKISKLTKSQKETLMYNAILNPNTADIFIKMSKGAPVSYLSKEINTALRNIAVETTKDPFGLKGDGNNEPTKD